MLLASLMLLASPALAGPRSPGPRHAALERVVALAEAGGDVPLNDLLVDALLAPDMGVLPEACAAELRKGRAATNMGDQANAYARALRDLCPPTCAGDTLGLLLLVPPERHVEALVNACDAQGPDPLFNTPELAARYAALGPALVAAMTHLPKVETSVPVVEGGIAQVDARAQVNASLRAVTACYTEALRGDPTVEGQIAVTATVDALGRTISGVEGTLPDALMGCVDEAVRSHWVFSAPPGDELGKVRVTFTLAPG